MKPICILVNPISGRGNSLKTLETVVIPMLESHNIRYEIYVTQQNMRVKDYLSEIKSTHLTRFRSVLVISGDGLLHETVNTILARSDWQEAIEVPLGIVPTGSGNGMAYTLVRRHDPHLPAGKEAILLCCKQALQEDTCLSDLIKITYGKSSTIWSVLSLGWGLLSDIDVDSDWLRPLGEFRFTIYGLLRACTAQSYHGKLSYRPLARQSSNTNQHKDHCDTITGTTNDAAFKDSKDEGRTQGDENEQDWIHIEDEFACLYAVYQSHISSATKFAPQSRLADQTIYLTYIRGRLSVIETVKFLLAIEDGSHSKLQFVTVVPVDSFKFQPLVESKVVVDGEIIPWTLADGPLTVEVVPKLMRLLWCRTPT